MKLTDLADLTAAAVDGVEHAPTERYELILTAVREAYRKGRRDERQKHGAAILDLVVHTDDLNDRLSAAEARLAPSDATPDPITERVDQLVREVGDLRRDTRVLRDVLTGLGVDVHKLREDGYVYSEALAKLTAGWPDAQPVTTPGAAMPGDNVVCGDGPLASAAVSHEVDEAAGELRTTVTMPAELREVPTAFVETLHDPDVTCSPWCTVQWTKRNAGVIDIRHTADCPVRVEYERQGCPGAEVSR